MSLLYRDGRIEVYGFRARRERPGSAHGVAAKIRCRNGWRHLSLTLKPRANKPIPGARGVVTCEASSWRTAPDKRTRASVKSFVRLKIGLGGAA